jgi:hypothetical protein
LSGAESLQAEDGIVKVQQEWEPGFESVMNDLSREAPAGGVISSPGAWAKLWKAWNSGVDAPEVDFEKALILVLAAPGPNFIIINDLRLTEDGDLCFSYSFTERGGPGFVAKMLKVDRRGIKTVNGKPLPTE